MCTPCTEIVQSLLAAQPAVGASATLQRLVDHGLGLRAAVTLERDECERYVHHRLTIAGGAAVTFSSVDRSDLRLVGRHAEARQPVVRASPGGCTGAFQPDRARDD
jgi:hypothetical protein